MSSILTNNSAMIALQTLKSINGDLSKTQSMISTGKEVGSAKDNAAVWSISKVMESDVQGFKAISSSLSLGESTVSVARQGAETVTDLLTSMKEQIVASQGQNVDREKIQADIDVLTNQIKSVVGAAQFNGLNLLSNDKTTSAYTAAGNVDGSGTVNVLSSLDRSDAGVAASNIDVSKSNLGTEATTDDGAAASLVAIESLIQTSIDAAASFGSAQGRIEIQGDFISNLSDALKSGIGTLVDANMEEASARLQALQVQQQLGVQSLSIANQAPQSILSLFR
ncbi:UNVERIFIED_CONTAM: hypothetical protein GTU68_054955 [Idotea baltica]|nr:hypothetical protein [Idotea baltica]